MIDRETELSIRREERERCARVAKEEADKAHFGYGGGHLGYRIEAAIRALQDEEQKL